MFPKQCITEFTQLMLVLFVVLATLEPQSPPILCLVGYSGPGKLWVNASLDNIS